MKALIAILIVFQVGCSEHPPNRPIAPPSCRTKLSPPAKPAAPRTAPAIEVGKLVANTTDDAATIPPALAPAIDPDAPRLTLDEHGRAEAEVEAIVNVAEPQAKGACLAGAATTIDSDASVPTKSAEVSSKLVYRPERKLRMLHFTATWCPPCRAIDAAIFNNPQALAALQARYDVERVDFDHDPRVQQYGVKEIPTDIILAADGTVLSRGVSTIAALRGQSSAVHGQPRPPQHTRRHRLWHLK